MKKTIYTIMMFLVTIVGCLSLSASISKSYVIPLQDEFYSDVYSLYSLLGVASPSYSQPWSGSEARLILDRICDKAKEYDSTYNIWNRLNEKLDDYTLDHNIKDGFSFDIGLNISPEVYIHTNSEDYVNDHDWYYGYEKRNMLADATIELGVKDFFYTYSELSFGKSRYSSKGTEIYSHEEDFPSGIGAIVPSWKHVKELYMKENGIINEEDLPEDWYVEYRYTANVVKSSAAYSSFYNDNTPFWDFWNLAANFPTRAFVSFGDSNWNILFGKERVNWGRSIIGNFTIDSHVGYHDVARLSIYTDSFKYEWNNLFLETAPYVSEVDKKGPDDIKIMMNHRLEFRPVSCFSFVLAESIMYRSGILELQMFNPAYIYHQLNNRDLFNSLASLELYYTPLKGWDIYYQLGLDNGTIPGEGNSQANAIGMLLGSSYSFGLGNGYLKASVEGAYTTPMMYRRDGIDFLMLQRDYTFIYLGSGTIKLNYIGFPYGSDATVAKAVVEYNIPNNIYSAFSVEFIRKGEINMFHTHNTEGNNDEKANIMGSTPYGDKISYETTLTLDSKYYLPKSIKWMDSSIFSSISYKMRWEKEKSSGTKSQIKNDLQFAFGLSVEF